MLTVNGFWEVLPLPKGDVICLHAFDGHLRLRLPHAAVSAALLALADGADETDVVEAAATRYGLAGRRAVETAIRQLTEAGVLIRSVTPKSSYRSSVDLRYQALLDWLVLFSPEDGGAALFNKLRSSQALLIGLGGAGSTCAAMLTASGIGGLTLVDGDRVAFSNLTRQIFYTEQQAATGAYKVNALAEYLTALNSSVRIDRAPTYISCVEDVRKLVPGHNLVILTADAPRILLSRWVNSACVAERCPFLYCFLGQVGPMFIPDRSPCFGCVEETWRQESGREYDEIVEALQVRHTREFPSMVSGPVHVGELLFTEAFAQLTGVYEPRSSNGTIRIGPGGEVFKPLRRHECCAECAPLQHRS